MYSYGDLLHDMGEHHDKLLDAIWRYGFGTGELTAQESRTAQRELSSLAAHGLGCVNPYAREVWEGHLRRAIRACRLDRGPMLMATILDRRWIMPRGDWIFHRDGIAEAVDINLDGLDHLLLIEFAPLAYPGREVVAAHLQGFVFGRLPQRRRRQLGKLFTGGLAGASGCRFRKVYDFVGASRYNVKPPDHLEVCFESRDDRRKRRHRGRKLPLKDHYFFWRHLRRYAYPDLTLAGGRGRHALELARKTAGLPV